MRAVGVAADAVVWGGERVAVVFVDDIGGVVGVGEAEGVDGAAFRGVAGEGSGESGIGAGDAIGGRGADAVVLCVGGCEAAGEVEDEGAGGELDYVWGPDVAGAPRGKVGEGVLGLA